MTETITRTSLTEDCEKPDEANLIAAAKKDPREFGQIYHLYIQPISRYLYSRIGNLPEAEDATAQTFLAALEALDRYQHKGHLAAWLFAIARLAVCHRAQESDGCLPKAATAGTVGKCREGSIGD